MKNIPDTLTSFCAGLTACVRMVSRESSVKWKLMSVLQVLVRMMARASTDLVVMTASVRLDLQVCCLL